MNMETLPQYMPHVIAAAAIILLALFLIWCLARRKKRKNASKVVVPKLSENRGVLYKTGKFIWFIIAGIFHVFLFLLKQIIPNMILVERLLIAAGIAAIAYTLIWPPVKYQYIGLGVFLLITSIVAHAYNDEMKRGK